MIGRRLCDPAETRERLWLRTPFLKACCAPYTEKAAVAISWNSSKDFNTETISLGTLKPKAPVDGTACKSKKSGTGAC